MAIDIASIAIAIPYEIRYLQRNGATANDVRHHLYLYQQGNIFSNADISKTVNAGEQFLSLTFIEDDMRQTMGPYCEFYTL